MGSLREDTESGPVADWAELPLDCLVTILSRLTLQERWPGTMLVCNSWLSACKDPIVNSVFNLETHFDSAAELPQWWTGEFERKIDSMLRSVVDWSAGSLKEIRIRHCSDDSLAFAAERCPNLELLSIRSCPRVTDDSISRIRCPKLRELDISYCYKISPKSLELIGRNCPNLKILKRNLENWPYPPENIEVDEYLNAYSQDGDSEATAIANSMPNLEWLEIRFSELSVEGLNSICQGCPKLEFLDLSGCANLTSRDVANASSNLEHLKEIKGKFL